MEAIVKPPGLDLIPDIVQQNWQDKDGWSIFLDWQVAERKIPGYACPCGCLIQTLKLGLPIPIERESINIYKVLQ